MNKSIKRVLLSSITLALLCVILYVYANRHTGIPILLYHHVNYTDKDSLCVTPERFEAQMRYLYENDYKTLFLDELDNIIKQGKRVPSKSVVITFDDGYLDNWVYAYPILKKYKLKATIFVITSYMSNSKKTRYNLEDVWKGRVRSSALPYFPDHNTVNLISAQNHKDAEKYFLTWDELWQMTDSGVIDIQSHSQTHKNYYINNHIVDFNYDSTWAIVTYTDGDVRLGIPIYEHASALTAKRFFDDKNLRNYMAEFVEKNGGKKFFKEKSSDYKKILLAEVEKYRKDHKLEEYYEDSEVQIERIKREMSLSRKVIKGNLLKDCQFIAWPWGEYNNEALRLAKEAGYKGAASTEKGSNTIKTDIWHLKRIKVWPRGNWWFSMRLFVYSNEPLADFVSLFTTRKKAED